MPGKYAEELSLFTLKIYIEYAHVKLFLSKVIVSPLYYHIFLLASTFNDMLVMGTALFVFVP